jgi:hypothetical protein
MSDLRPILQDNPNELEKVLLGSARLDAPPVAAKGRALAALGFAAVTTTTAGAGGATTVATSGAALVIKWLAIGVIGSAVTLGVAEGLSPTRSASRAAPGTIAARSVPEPRPSAHLVAIPVAPSALPASAPISEAVRTEMPEREAQPEPPASPAGAPDVPLSRIPQAPPAPRAAAPTSAATPAFAIPAGPEPPHETARATFAPQSTLAAEVIALGEARRALTSGEAVSSLSLLETYDRRFVQPTLALEATVLRIEALVALGRLDEARRLARGMLVAHPDSPYAQRVRSLVGPAASDAP